LSVHDALRLSTEAGWEYAAKGGTHIDAVYYWGDTLKKDGACQANIFQGTFPTTNSKEDGFEGKAPVKTFPPNGYDLYDMAGNVLEWCSDYYRLSCNTQDRSNPIGPTSAHDPEKLGQVIRVQRRGLIQCADEYCERCKAEARVKGELNSATNNVGFRCIKDVHLE